MATSLNNLKNRLGSIKSTKKLTNAMKLVSSAKEKKLSNEYNLAIDFYNRFLSIFNNTIFINPNNPDCDSFNNNLLKNYESEKRLLIVITSNNGLCSGYNNEVIRFLKNYYQKNDEILIIGEKGRNELIKEDIEINEQFVGYLKEQTDNFDDLKNYLVDVFNKGIYREIDLIYTHYHNSLISKVEAQKLLPIDIKENKKRNYSPTFEPTKDEIINYLIEEYLYYTLFIKIFDSRIAEESARRLAMENATKNADELIDDLNLEYNKIRQSNITSEINEVSSASKIAKRWKYGWEFWCCCWSGRCNYRC